VLTHSFISRAQSFGEYETEGNVLNYLLAGCPAVVANLWDVTDVDLDLFSKELLSVWIDGKASCNSAPFNPVSLPCKLNWQRWRWNSLRVTTTFSLLFSPACVAVSRKACKWPFIVGAAPVCYGVPVEVSKTVESIINAGLL